MNVNMIVNVIVKYAYQLHEQILIELTLLGIRSERIISRLLRLLRLLGLLGLRFGRKTGHSRHSRHTGHARHHWIHAIHRTTVA